MKPRRKRTRNNNPGIYMLRSKADPELFYIGGTKHLAKRKENYKNIKHYPSYHKLIDHTIKYGYSDLEFIVIEQCKIEDVYKKEQYYISEFNPTLNTNKIATNSHDMMAGIAKECFYSDFIDDHKYNKKKRGCRNISPREEYLFNLLNELAPEILIPLNI